MRHLNTRMLLYPTNFGLQSPLLNCVQTWDCIPFLLGGADEHLPLSLQQGDRVKFFTPEK